MGNSIPNQYEKLVKQQARLKQKLNEKIFKLRQSKYYENRQARKARSRQLIQKEPYSKNTFRLITYQSNKPKELLKYLLITLMRINRTNSKRST